MSAFGTDDHQSLFAYLGGLIVLVFAGILLSLTLEKRRSSNMERIDLRSEISSQSEHIHDLKRDISLHKARLEGDLIRRNQERAEIDQLEALAAGQAIARRRLEQAIESLTNENDDLKGSIADTTQEHRSSLRREMLGTTHSELILEDGSRYQDVTIRSITQGVLSFAHSRGLARVSLQSLNADWKRRLAWSPEELTTGPVEEPAPVRRPGGKPMSPGDTRRPTADSKKASVEQARSEFIKQRDLYRRAVSEASIARSKSYGPDRSVPGSLETWAERAARMEKLAAKLRVSYTLARNTLSELSPGDPLLR